MQKILIVDDERIMLKIASKILSKDYEIICAGSGAEAIEKFQREKPDLVLTDLLMPELDGYELQQILQEKSSEPVPVMFMTADEREESESKGFRLGASDYIRKPLKADVLLRRVKNVLDKIDQIKDLTEAANLDLMTGLLNKTATQKEISKLCSKSQGVLMILDLDNFKLVNDLYGHAMGDKILIRFADLIKGLIRATDVAGRIGGDEFLVFCQNIVDDKIIFGKINFLNQQLLISAKNFMGDDMNIPLGVSAGAVFIPNEGTNFVQLAAKADKALYKVKNHGKHGCAFFGKESFKDNFEQKNTRTQLILAERNQESGAYFTNFESFKAIYQYMTRLGANNQLLELEINDDSDEKCAKFLEILLKNLRRNDCVTQYGHEFLILLNDVAPENVEIVREKILTAWQKKRSG